MFSHAQDLLSQAFQEAGVYFESQVCVDSSIDVQSETCSAARGDIESETFIEAVSDIESETFTETIENETCMEAVIDKESETFTEDIESETFTEAIERKTFIEAIEIETFTEAIEKETFIEAIEKETFTEAIERETFIETGLDIENVKPSIFLSPTTFGINIDEYLDFPLEDSVLQLHPTTPEGRFSECSTPGSLTRDGSLSDSSLNFTPESGYGSFSSESISPVQVGDVCFDFSPTNIYQCVQSGSTGEDLETSLDELLWNLSRPQGGTGVQQSRIQPQGGTSVLQSRLQPQGGTGVQQSRLQPQGGTEVQQFRFQPQGNFISSHILLILSYLKINAKTHRKILQVNKIALT